MTCNVLNDKLHTASSVSAMESNHLRLCSSESSLLICSEAWGNGLRGESLLLGKGEAGVEVEATL